MTKIINLALKGGGVKGIAYVGALRELEKVNIYQGIERVSGTSAGALVAGMVAVGYSPDDIGDLMHGLNFEKFKGGWNPIRIFTKYGLYDGDYILNFIHDFLAKSPGRLDKNATFDDLKKANCKDLIVFASDINLHTIAEFSYFQTPKCIVAEAIRASMSIPLFFKSWKFSNNIPNEHLYVDGGLVYNYPLSFFDKPRFHETGKIDHDASMGLYLESKQHYDVHAHDENGSENETTETKKMKKKNYFHKINYYSKILTYFKHSFETLLNAQDIDFMEESHLVSRTVFISDLGFSSTDFNLSKEDKKKLVESGSAGAKKHMEWLNDVSKKNN